MEKGKTQKKSKREIIKKDRIRNQKHAKDVKNMWKQGYCEKCNSWYHYECEDTAKKQIIKMYPDKTQYICKEDQKIEYEKNG